MKPKQWLKQSSSRYMERLHLKLAHQEALLQLALLGAVSGLVAGLGMVAFRLLIGISPPMLLGADDPQQFEYLDPWFRLLLPTVGGLVVGLLLHRLANADRQVGVVHVMERLAYHEGQMPIKNAGVQFVSAVLCILSGQSVGREGPSIHIGAACGSWMGQRLLLPNNSVRVLVGCGSAGAIAAAFNTPLAGVIFAMEVVLVEYSLSGFIPIILAAVSAATLARWVFGSAPIFVIPRIELGALDDLVSIVFLGVIVGALASGFVHTLMFFFRRANEYPIVLRLTIAGAFTGLVGLAVPEIMGIGYDSVNDILLGKLGLGLLLLIVGAKLVATAVGLGLGLPGGIIGPTLVMGAAVGGAVGMIANSLAPGATSATFYAMLGMGAMMGATLNAPLAALTALLELTANHHVILPGMLAVVAAGITSQQIFKTPSVFVKQMQARGLDYASHPLSQFLRRLGVAHSMDRQVVELSAPIGYEQLETVQDTPSTWILVRDEPTRGHVYFTADLLRQLEAGELPEEDVDLQKLRVHRLNAAPVSAQSTLWGALQMMDRKSVDALFVLSRSRRLLGVITRQDIERSYRHPLH